MDNKNKQILLHLSLIPGIGPGCALKIIKKLFDDFCAKQKHPQIQSLNFDLQQIYDFKVYDFINEFGLTRKIATDLVAGLVDKKQLETEVYLLEKNPSIKVLTFLDDEYPQNLKEIYAPPVVIYCQGAQLETFEKNIAIVGARKADEYAQQVIYDLVPELVKKDYTIVSGGAIGADSMAHRATLDFEGKTVAVLGSGLLKFYPFRNINLFNKIVEKGGTLVSPFPLKFGALPGNFPARNRVIAGLSFGCLVIQAAKKSGALITAQFALDEGRQVFAVPGPIYHELSLGCHEIIKQGAKLVSGAKDILEELPGAEQEEQRGINFAKPVEDAEKDVEKEQVLMDSDSSLIISILKNACSIDELAIKTKLDLDLLQEKLFDLQLDGKIKQNFVGSWERI
jgi:DNA processing protein